MTTPTAPSKTVDKPRYHDLDILYVLVLGGVIVSHVLIVFCPFANLPPYPVKNPTVYGDLWVVTVFAGLGAIPIFFVLAGWTSMLVLGRQPWRRYLVDRVKRLGVPFLFGMVTIVPVIKYVELRTGYIFQFKGPTFDNPWTMSYGEYLGKAFSLQYISWQHLWFLVYLFAISVLACPVMLWLSRQTWLRLPEADSRPKRLLFAYGPMLFTGGFVAIWGSFWPFRPTLVTDPQHVSIFGMWFLMGAIVALNPQLERAVRQEWWRLGSLGLLIFAGHIMWPDTWLGSLALGAAGWGMFGGALGLISALKPKGGKTVDYLRDAGMPIYILHNVVAVLFAWQIVQTGWPVPLKMLAILIPTLVISLGLYHYLVRPIPFLRACFGLRPLSRKSPQGAAGKADAPTG